MVLLKQKSSLIIAQKRMEDYSFQAELKNYKIVRRIDFHKVYWNKKVIFLNIDNSI